MAPSFISVKKFEREPYSEILGYPRATPRQIRSRIAELEKLDIRSLSLSGPTRIGKLSILGKGYVGVVVLAKKKSRQVALKIRRTDSQRDGMKREARMLHLANSAGVGPKVLDASRNFMVMEYLDGHRMGSWAAQLRGPGSAKKLKAAVRKILDDCYRLDRMNLDHGELSNITKHVIVGKKASLIDFEGASTRRRPSNVTSITQAIFIGSGIAKSVRRIYRNPPKGDIIAALRHYKQEGTRESFEALLGTLKL